MKIYYRPHPKLTVEMEVADQKDFVEQLAKLQEVVVHTCQKCKKGGIEDLRYRVREVDENRFYELVCTNCGASLSFGAHKKGNTLFPKVHFENEEGQREYLPNNGWTHYNSKTGKLE